MLESLLEKLRCGGTYSLADLSREYDVSQSQMQQMVLHLVRLGYLKSTAGCDSSGCPGCSIKSACSAKTPVRLWSFSNLDISSSK